MAGTHLRITYFKYLLDKFNIVSIVADYMGGVQFINAVNESSLFKKDKVEFGVVDVKFDDLSDYQSVLAETRKQYNLKSRKIFSA